MHIVIAPDSYKGSLSSIEVGEAVKKGLQQALPEATYTVIPMADGGEGTLAALLYHLDAEKVRVTTRGPVGQNVAAVYAIHRQQGLALIESAAMVGLPLLAGSKLDPLQTTTFGLGETIRHALDQGIRKFVVGIGGSATNDGGAGLLEALGAQFFQNGHKLEDIRAKDLANIDHVDLSALDERIKACTFTIASDVDNPLCGERGASAVFGPQKGATPDTVQQLDQALRHFARLLDPDHQWQNKPGAGAAGGLGFAFMLLGGVLQPGAEVVAQALSMERLLDTTDLLITGEGKTDEQTRYGKAPYYLAQLAKKRNIPVILLSGSLGDGYQALFPAVDASFSIIRHPVTVEEAMSQASQWVEEAAVQIGRLLNIARGSSP